MRYVTSPGNLNPKGYQQIPTPSNSSLTIPPGAEVALLQATDQNIRFRDDLLNPTASVGMVLVVGANPFPYVGDLSKLRFTEAVAGAVLNVSYYSIVS